MSTRGGARVGAGRPAGVPNRRTQETINRAAARGATDPLDSLLDLQKWALTEKKRAEKLLAAFDAAHGARIEKLETDILAKKTAKQREKAEEELKPLNQRRTALVNTITGHAERAAGYAKDAAPYLHARLASVDGTVGDRSHEDMLDELDDDGPNWGGDDED